MKQEVNPQDTNRAKAFGLWMKSPQPTVTIVKTIDVTRLRKISRRKGMKFNMLLCWCIGRAASAFDEFYLLPVKDKLYRYDRLALNVIVNNSEGGISLCDVPYSDDLQQFSRDYDTITQECAATGRDIFDEEANIIGTSAITATEFDCLVNQYSGIYNNPYLAWGRYRRHWLRYKLAISIQFHHAQMDGTHAARFLEALQTTMNTYDFNR